MPTTSSVERTIAKWALTAGIRKHVTFHKARHSYATMALTAGADLYTISKLLGHRNISTTTIYATVIDAKRDAATDSVGKLFQEHFSRRQNE
jgi:site-specific recombinase XerD